MTIRAFGSMEKTGIAVAVAMALALSGCATKRDHYDVPAVALPGSFSKPSPATAHQDASSSKEKPEANPGDSEKVLAEWWQVLGTPELDALIERGLARNSELRVAVHRIAQTQARADQAGADQMPVITAPLQVSNKAPVDGIGTVPSGGEVRSQKTYQASLRADWRVDVWGERQALAESAALQVWRARFQRDDVQRTLVANIAATYLDCLSLNDRLRVARETETVLTGMLSSVQDRLDKGDATITELEQQRSAVFAAKATIPALEQQREEARHNLALLVGAVPGTLVLSDQGLESLVRFPTILPGAPSALLMRRPDVRLVEARLIAADADIDVARARVLPPLDLSAQVGYGSFVLSQLFQPQTLFWNAVANLSATIFDKGKRDNEVAFSRAVHEELVETYVRVSYNAVREVEDALTAIQMTGKRLMDQQTATDAAQRAWEYSRESYQAGAIDYLVLLDTERTYHRNLDELHRIRLDRYRAYISLYAALGGGSQIADRLPGEGKRPTMASAVAADQSVSSTKLAPGVSYDGFGFVGDAAMPESWLAELAEVPDRTHIAATFRYLREKSPGPLKGRIMLTRLANTAPINGTQGETRYRLFLGTFTTPQSAIEFCAMLNASNIACQAVPAKTISAQDMALKLSYGLHLPRNEWDNDLVLEASGEEAAAALKFKNNSPGVIPPHSPPNSSTDGLAQPLVQR